ncbi:anionic trypsin-2-like [Convolutriloba macropyga]|uniref:anionic trypsin-2-like n=1 Tax=Convolutriloba macropyga TaxID=536237 RepID=UPI003F52282B
MSGLHGAIFLIILGFNNAFNIRSFDNDNLSLDETEEKRIDDQKEVTANSASWMAQIQFPGIDGLGISHFYCQGVLYQKMFILTSTKCFPGVFQDANKVIPGTMYEYIRVYIGNDYHIQSGQKLKLIDVKEVIKHEDFDYENGDNDIVIFVLEECVPMNGKTSKVNIPETRASPGTVARLFDWRREEGGMSDAADQIGDILDMFGGNVGDKKLISESVQILPESDCKSYYPSEIPDTIDAKICVEGEKSVDTKCLSEKGAPICKFVPNSFGCHDCELLGIVTSGKGCSNYISGSRLAIDIFGFKNWIDEKIAKYQNNNKTVCENSGETEDKGEVDDVDEEPNVDKL